VKRNEKGPGRHVARGAGAALAAAVLLSAGAVAFAQTTKMPDKVTLRSQLGIIYAQNGDNERARTEFTTLLEEPTGRAAALTNLGNLAVLDGKVDVGLENYRQAAALDTSDGGILLDLGLALKMAGRDDEATTAFSRALTKAGGEERAAYLLGVRTDEGDTSKGKVTKLSNEEIKAMLAKARTRVPEATNTSAGKDQARTQVVSRPGGARASDMGVGPTSFYWKEK
jgi:tetratricopeptide (TPR) repeat protein